MQCSAGGRKDPKQNFHPIRQKPGLMGAPGIDGALAGVPYFFGRDSGGTKPATR